MLQSLVARTCSARCQETATTPTEFVEIDLTRGQAQVAERDGQDSVVVWVSGEHDLCSEASLVETLSWAMGLGAGHLILDLSGVSFMSAGTIGVIVSARDQLSRKSRSLAVRSPSGIARRVIDLCGLTDLIHDPNESLVHSRKLRCARHLGGRPGHRAIRPS